MSKTYRVFFHAGDEIGIKTRVEKGHAFVDGAGLHVRGAQNIDIPLSTIREVKLFRLHGMGRVVKVDHSGGRLFVSVVRLMIGQFAFINFFKTGELHKQLCSSTSARA